MGFMRRDASCWHRDVPGARWFKADLHTHTIDDHPGGRAKLPPGVTGPVDSQKTIEAYARHFLQSAVAHGVSVLGITPHAIRAGATAGTSAVWRIVEEWNDGVDDDGVSFREKIYAIFPGFEPSLNQGKSGLHLLFLFDPEIGQEAYEKAFGLAMGATPSPWREKQLQLSSKKADDVFSDLSAFREEAISAKNSPKWNYITLAPHLDNDKGLLGAQKAQVLKRFEHGAVAGLELGDEMVAKDAENGRPWLIDGMMEHHQAFFHGSDAYRVDHIGRRHTWFKLASPRIEALRQAFIAAASRIRIGHERDGEGRFVSSADPPDVTVNTRPWLKSVTLTGKASFFGRTDHGGSRFEFSPDLTCIIGGSMTGKSTLLDGLRVHVGADPPKDEGIRNQVEARGRHRFLGGSPEVKLECPGRDPTALPREQWPAIFYAQNELQRLAQDPDAVQGILTRLVASETDGILAREKRLTVLERELGSVVKNLAKLDDDLAEAEQAAERCRSAAKELAAFSDAGIARLHKVSRDHLSWKDTSDTATDLAADVGRALQAAVSFAAPDISEWIEQKLCEAGVDENGDAFRERLTRIRHGLESAKDELAAANVVVTHVVEILRENERNIRTDVERGLAERGVDSTRIKEFQSLSQRSALLTSYEASADQTRDKRDKAEHTFATLLNERKDLIHKQRAAFDRVMGAVHADFDGRIVSRRIDHGDRTPLEQFLKSLNQRGITRWWNELEDKHRPAPDELLKAFDEDKLVQIKMSGAVQKTFREVLGRSQRRKLAAVHCRDRYVLESALDDGTRRRLDDLSGGQRVSVLLSLLLKTDDERPLVIDQPEDELDNRFLFDTVLPALKRLKGRRQIIVATHNANVVVNGDADQVIQLDATANRGQITSAGAIEDPVVRDAIVRTVDGGDDAFRLRRLKYGF